MNNPKKHHFVPKFLLKQWIYKDKKLWLYLKNDIGNSPKLASTSDVGHEKNLYTTTNGEKKVETDFFGEIDRNASEVHRKILLKKVLNNEDKRKFTQFISTLHIRNPELINEMKLFNENRRVSNLSFAEKQYEKNGDDDRKLFEKKQYDDTAKLVQIFSTIGEETAMSKQYEKDFETILSADWRIYNNESVYNFITCDFPMLVIPFSGSNTNGFALPETFGIVLPLSPQICLIISNSKSFLNETKHSPQKEFVKKVNVALVKKAINQIFAKEDCLKQFISENYKA
ncbi:MAG: DUF4238 domain-containing protein [Bacteroidales bacterium]|nr:DUF4238 domain-containing protein [Bacteroidales bacterium]